MSAWCEKRIAGGEATMIVVMMRGASKFTKGMNMASWAVNPNADDDAAMDCPMPDHDETMNLATPSLCELYNASHDATIIATLTTATTM